MSEEREGEREKGKRKKGQWSIGSKRRHRLVFWSSGVCPITSCGTWLSLLGRMISVRVMCYLCWHVYGYIFLRGAKKLSMDELATHLKASSYYIEGSSVKTPQHCSYRLNNEVWGDDDRVGRQDLTTKTYVYIQLDSMLPLDVS